MNNLKNLTLASFDPGDIVQRNGRKFRVGDVANRFGGIYIIDLETNEKTIQPLFREYELVEDKQIMSLP